jgi:ribonuclease VapC
MILDASAVLAVLYAEPDAERFARVISDASFCRMSVATFVEISIVVESQAGDIGSRQWDLFFRRAGITLEPVSEEQAYTARQAWSDYGRQRHPANLNFGDCYSYALAKTLGEPLLFKGHDFSLTDISPAV